MGLIDVRDVRFAYTRAGGQILNGINLEIERGEFIALFGQSKSTLLLTLCGAIPHLIHGRFEGDVLIDGKNTRELSLSEIVTRVGVVLQDPENQLFNLTVEGDVCFGMENLGVPREQMEDRLVDMLDTVRMLPYRHRMSHELSGGQKQRVAIASVLAMQPEILLLDEPTRELDPLGTEEVFEVLGRLKKRGTTIVIIENDPDYIAPLADRMVLLRDGEIAVCEEPRRFYEILHQEDSLRVPQVADLYLRVRERLGLNGMVPLTVEEGVECFGHGTPSSDHSGRGRHSHVS